MPPASRDRVRRAISAVGQVFVSAGAQPGNRGPFIRGSAVVVRKDGIVATNYHVIADDRTGELFNQIFFDLADQNAQSKPNRYRLAPVLISKEYDLALLKIAADDEGKEVSPTATFPVIELADSRRVQPLDDLVIIGFPQKGLGGATVNRGLVEGVDALGNWIKTSARVLHGNSGGAAVNLDGKLIGIPTKVLVDKKLVDEDGDGFPDGEREYGAVGFLRPSNFVATLLAQLDSPAKPKPKKMLPSNASVSNDPERMAQAPAPKIVVQPALIKVRGMIRSIKGMPVAGARVGLLPLGAKQITAESLLTWGGTNADGKFELNNSVPPGKYTLKVKAFGYEMYSGDVEIKQDGSPIEIELRPIS